MAMGTGGAGTGTTATWGVLGSADVDLPVLTAADAACAGPTIIVSTLPCRAIPWRAWARQRAREGELAGGALHAHHCNCHSHADGGGRSAVAVAGGGSLHAKQAD